MIILDESFDGTKPPEKTETFKMLKLFLTQVSYDVKETDEKDQLTLSTIHQSKGLEWPIGNDLPKFHSTYHF